MSYKISDITGLKEEVGGFNKFKILGGLTRDEYTLFLIVFEEDNELGIFIWNNFNNIFSEEPDTFEGYEETEESFIEKYPELEYDLEDWKESQK